MWHLSEASRTNFVFPTRNLFFLIDKLRKHCHKFTRVLQLSQSCEQEDFNSSN